MADIFISHSGGDSEVAAPIGDRNRREPPSWSLFYDKDNIRAVQRRQERLHEELTRCWVVLALLSRNCLGSPWCFTEAVTATFRGMDVVGIETEDLTGDDLARTVDPARTPARRRGIAVDGPRRPDHRVEAIRWARPSSSRRSGAVGALTGPRRTPFKSHPDKYLRADRKSTT